MTGRLIVAVGIVVALAGCRFDPVATVGRDGGGLEDVFGEDRRLPDVVEPDRMQQECDPGTATGRCAPDKVTPQTCSADGHWENLEACPLACVVNEQGRPYCADTLLFSNNVDARMVESVSDEITGDGCDQAHPIVVDTTALSVTLNGNSLVSTPLPEPFGQVNGHGIELMVLPLKSLVVPEGCRMRISGNRALAIVVADRIQIAGTVDASADGLISGPGALPDSLACHGGDGQDGGVSGLGGGGGGARFGQGGAGGGAASVAGGGGDAMPNVTLEPLMGGCSGGTGAEKTISSTLGGMGGGALMLACTGQIHISGTVTVNGGPGASSSTAAGGGGGSGGSLLIEGPDIEVTGSLLAEGGRGGDGAGAAGGEGGHDSTPNGQPGAVANAVGGGGGGGVGQIRINTIAVGTVVVTGRLSPAEGQGARIVIGGLEVE